MTTRGQAAKMDEVLSYSLTGVAKDGERLVGATHFGSYREAVKMRRVALRSCPGLIEVEIMVHRLPKVLGQRIVVEKVEG